MKICMLSSELSPFAKTGGLGDAVAGLARFLSGRGVDLRLFAPGYASSNFSGQEVLPVDFLQDQELDLGGRRERYSVWTTTLPNSALPVYLIQSHFFGREGIYDQHGDEHLRFALFSRAVIETCQRMGFGPDVFHLNDWHTALVPLYLRALYDWDDLFRDSRTLLTIHNLAYQGLFPARAAVEVGLGGHLGLLHQEELEAGRFSFMVSGILYADAIAAVSETYAHEIQTPALGFGLDGLLRRRSADVVGLVNGVDYAEWDPSVDPHIERQYSIDTLEEKTVNKVALLEQLGLDPAPGDPADLPVLGLVSRLTAQKGFDLLFEPLAELLAAHDVRLAALGNGESRYEHYFRSLEYRFPGRAAFYCGFHNGLAHKIQAGADLFLMPSRYEPCGLTQLYSLRYGTVPVVHRTGGLADTVQLYDSASGEGTGFVFDHFQPEAARWALGYALASFRDRDRWRQLQRNGMARDFSWEKQGEGYLELYRKMVE